MSPISTLNDAFPQNPYAHIEQAELKALRAFYAAWLEFHAVNVAQGDGHFRRKRLECAATKLANAAAEVRKFDPKVVQ